jgi:glycine C-acetyltransferase
MARACDAGVYPYQIALNGRSGPMVRAEGRDLLMLSSYDYLGLIGDRRIDDAAVEAVRKYGTGTGGVRLLTGTIDLHRLLEAEIAAFKRMPQAITFSSGYLANVGVLAALLSPQDRVVMDALSHRSLLDACRMSGVEVVRFEHNDMDSLRRELQRGSANRTLIIADGVFSMDGDICRLPDLIAIKKEFDCYLMIDEAHATGVLGAGGRGTDEHYGVGAEEVDIWTGSLAKAIPSNGGFAAVSEEVGVYLQHAAAPFIFSAALCPAAVAAAREAIEILQNEPRRVARVRENASFLRAGLRDLGYDVGKSETAIVPVILRSEEAAALFSAQLLERGILAVPVLFPAVAQGAARLRLCVTAAHSRDQLQFALDVFQDLRKCAPLMSSSLT